MACCKQNKNISLKILQQINLIDWIASFDIQSSFICCISHENRIRSEQTCSKMNDLRTDSRCSTLTYLYVADQLFSFPYQAYV